jgi:hypothetical protein
MKTMNANENGILIVEHLLVTLLFATFDIGPDGMRRYRVT